MWNIKQNILKCFSLLYVLFSLIHETLSVHNKRTTHGVVGSSPEGILRGGEFSGGEFSEGEILRGRILRRGIRTKPVVYR